MISLEFAAFFTAKQTKATNTKGKRLHKMAFWRKCALNRKGRRSGYVLRWSSKLRKCSNASLTLLTHTHTHSQRQQFKLLIIFFHAPGLVNSELFVNDRHARIRPRAAFICACVVCARVWKIPLLILIIAYKQWYWWGFPSFVSSSLHSIFVMASLPHAPDRVLRFYSFIYSPFSTVTSLLLKFQ